MRLHGKRDTRGASLVEHLILVGLVAMLCLAGFRLFGASVGRTAEAKAACITNLECPGAGSEALVPGRSELVAAAAKNSEEPSGMQTQASHSRRRFPTRRAQARAHSAAADATCSPSIRST